MAMRPYTTLRNLLVHPKDKVSKEYAAECVYTIPGKAARKSTLERWDVVLEFVWRNTVRKWNGKKYTRSTRKQSLSEQNKSAITDNTKYHIIDWEEATIIGQESDWTTLWVREAVIICQEGQDIMNKDEGFFLLSGAPCGAGAPLFPLVHLLPHLFPLHFSLSFICFTYFLLCPSLPFLPE